MKSGVILRSLRKRTTTNWNCINLASLQVPNSNVPQYYEFLLLSHDVFKHICIVQCSNLTTTNPSGALHFQNNFMYKVSKQWLG